VDAVPHRDVTFPFDGIGLDRLTVHRYALVLLARERVVIPAGRLPNILRGAFEMAFRRLVCHDVTLDCPACPLFGQCPYPAVFRPSPPPGSDRLSKAQDLPRPFVFEPPVNHQATLAPGDELRVGLTVFGKANRWLPYLVVAFQALAERGVGPTRGRMQLTRVTALGPSAEHDVFELHSNVVRPSSDGLRLTHMMRSGDDHARRVRVRFSTPTTLKRDGHLVERPSFADLVCRIRDRLSSLATFFGDGPLEMDFAGVSRAAADVRAVECRTAWSRRTRRSSRTGHVHELSGFVGDALYEGDLRAWMPLLRMGEAVHVGKYAVWGNGQLEVTL
jgi:hypothetical protein